MPVDTKSYFPNTTCLNTGFGTTGATGTTRLTSTPSLTMPSGGSVSNCILEVITAMQLHASTTSMFMQVKTEEIRDGSKRARDSQQGAVKTDGVVSQLKKPDATADLPRDVLAYLKGNNVPIGLQNGQGIDDYLKSINKPDGVGLNKGELETIKGALEADGGRNNDLLTAGGTTFQRLMQNLNNAINMISSAQVMSAEMNKNIIAGIR